MDPEAKKELIEGRLHNGLVDARNTAKLFSKMMLEEELTFNGFYEEAHDDKVNHLGTSLGSLLSGIKLEVCA